MSWTVVPAAALAEHVPRWNALHQASAASPLLAPDFVATALESFGSGGELLAWYEEADITRAMTVLAPSRAGIWNTFQPPQAPLGLWLQADQDFPRHLVQDLLRALPGVSLMLGITQCDPMLLARPASRGDLRTLDYIETARISLSLGFDAYWEARGKNLRANLKKQRKRLAQDGIATRLQLSHAPEDMAAAVNDYGMLETKSWKAAAGSAVSGNNEQGRFYRSMLESFARRGAARVYRYWIGERLAAMDLCIEGGGSLVILKTSYDESLDRHLSPALLMREEAFRAVFAEQRFERIEFYGRVMDWHLRWTDEVRTMYHLNVYRWPGIAGLHDFIASLRYAFDNEREAEKRA